MQTTLLGLAIAFIIALVAALMGPFFIDWNQFRAQFEAEATRALGAPVRVNGMLDARLLPTPTLRLRAISVGGASDQGSMSADSLDVEFSLGSLMRGEWRASELSIGGFSLAMGLDKQGRIEGPLSGERFSLGGLAIDRLNLAGRIALRDGASGKVLDLDDLKFSGDVRTLAGTMRGEGSFRLFGARTPFRVSSGQSSDGKGTRLRLSLDPDERVLFADLDGVLTFDASVPKFDGALTLARPADAKSPQADAGLPWRVSSRIKASAASATLEQVEANYGPDDNALKFTGAGDMRFGASPLLHVVLSARQLDADRVFNKGGEPLRLMTSVRRAIAALPVAAFPTNLEVSADQVALGGRPIQNAAIDIRSAADGWRIEKFEMRAPGVTRLSANGAISAATFAGPVSIESAEPDALMAWLEGRSDVAYRQKPLRLKGDVTLASDRIAIEALQADLDGDLAGRIVVSGLPDNKTRLEAALTSQSLNIDPANPLLAMLMRPRAGQPDEASISLDIAKATVSGLELRPIALDLNYSPKAIVLGRLTVGEAGGATLNGSGSFARGAGNGKFSLNAGAPSLARIGTLIAPFAPTLADRLKAVEATPGAATVRLAIDLEEPKEQPKAGPAMNIRAGFSIDAPQLKGAITLTASPALDADRSIDFAALTRSEFNIETKLSSDKSQSMLALLGLDRVFSAREGAAQFDASATGVWGAPFRVTAKLSGASIDGDAQGTADVFAQPPKANLTLTIRRADISALFDLKPMSLAGMSLSSRLNMANNVVTFDDLDTTFGGSRVRGKLALTQGEARGIDGEVGIDTLDVPAVIAVAFGAAGHGISDPLGHGWLRGWRGSLAFQTLKATLPGGGELRPFGGTLKSDGQSLALDGKGSMGGGTITANADARQTAEGTSFTARVNVADAEGPALLYRGLALPPGKASLQLSLTSQGRSAAALAGAVSGAGTVTLKDARIAALDPAAFDAAVRASDDGKPTDDANLKPIVEPVLTAGALQLPAAQIPFGVKDGRLRVAPVPIEAARARVTISGGYDLAADQTDVRVILSANVIKPETGRPEIRIDLNGSPDAPSRTLDVASLSSWLALRSIDRETRKLDRLERGVAPVPDRELQPPPEEELPAVEPLPRSEVKMPSRDPRRRNANAKAAVPAAAPAPNAAPQVQPLPPPIAVRPAPGTAKLQKPKPPMVLTP